MELDGKTLRAAREHLELSQMEAAERLKVSLVAYQRWEQGKSKPQPFHRRMIRAGFREALYVLGVIGKDDLPSPGNLETVSALAEHSISEEKHSPDILAPDLPPTIPEIDELQIFIASNMTTHLWHLAHLENLTIEERRCRIKQAIKEFDCMDTTNKNYQTTRREALFALATLPMITLNWLSPTDVRASHYGSALNHCAASLEACWELGRSKESSDVILAFKSASRYLSLLETIANNGSQNREAALDLAARYALIKAFLSWHCVGSTAAVPHAKHAIALSRQVDDISLLLSAHSKLAWGYFYDKKYSLALSTAQEAEGVIKQYYRSPNAQPLHPCVQGGIYSTLALMQTKNGRPPDSALGKATEVDPGKDPYAFMNFTQSSFLLESGITYCYHGNQRKAMEMLGQRVDLKTLAPKIPQSELGRIETINTMTLSSLKAADRDMEQTIHLWVGGIEGAKALKSEQRFNEALTTYEIMEVVWPDEERIKNLRELTVHW